MSVEAVQRDIFQGSALAGLIATYCDFLLPGGLVRSERQGSSAHLSRV